MNIKAISAALKISLLSLLFLTLVLSCAKDDAPIEEPAVIIEFNEVSDFIWKGLNYWYYWQPIMTDLSDSKISDLDTYHNYLNTFSSPKDLFKSIIDKNIEDDFSWYIEDVDEQLKQFAGTNKSYGIRLGRGFFQVANNNGVYIHIAYVVPNSPAQLAGLKRGDVIYKVDGIEMNSENYTIINNLFNNDAVTLGVGRFNNETKLFVPNTNELQISRIEYNATPIQHYEVIETGNKKVGYLVYTGFKYPFHKELNDVFTLFKAAQIDELVLDLRYNGGGTVITAAFLASMINGNVSTSTIFADLKYNSKRNKDEGSAYPFFKDVYLYDFDGNFKETISMTRLNTVSKLYVLTSDATASASEMIINGLRPFMAVETIGGTTVGKNEGSITVVDSPNTFNNPDNRNPSHTIGIQPIVFQIYNSLGQNDYDNGFVPLIELNEMDYAKSIKDFGDPNEPFLQAALNRINGSSAKLIPTEQSKGFPIGKPIKLPKFSQDMYLIPGQNQ
jgi:C-terminal processing protease CtpA/Prc